MGVFPPQGWVARPGWASGPVVSESSFSRECGWTRVPLSHGLPRHLWGREWCGEGTVPGPPVLNPPTGSGRCALPGLLPALGVLSCPTCALCSCSPLLGTLLEPSLHGLPCARAPHAYREHDVLARRQPRRRRLGPSSFPLFLPPNYPSLEPCVGKLRLATEATPPPQGRPVSLATLVPAQQLLPSLLSPLLCSGSCRESQRWLQSNGSCVVAGQR